MDEFSVSSINATIFENTIKDYSSWKKKRQLLTSQLGQYLLDYNEQQLSLIISHWETELAKFSQIKTIEANMTSLLSFSVLHFFFRSFDHVKKHFPMVNSLCSSENKDVCQAATTTLRYLADENVDNFSFLRISLESVSSFLKSKNNRSLYNGLLILRQCGRFIPSDVFGITINTMPEIWSAICSPDKSLQKVAVKVINIHLLRVPSNTQESYAQSLAFDCYSMMNSKQSSSYTGFILTLRCIYSLFPKSIEISSLVSKLVASLLIQTNDIPIETYKFLLLLASENNSVLSKDQALSVFSSLLSFLSSNQNNSYLDLFDSLDSFIQVLPNTVIQLDEIINKLSSLLPTIQNKKILNRFFKVFCTIMKLFPQQQIPIDIFTNHIPCKNALIALRMRIGLLMEIREPLMKTFHEGLNPKSDFYQQKTSLRIFSTFQNILFERIDEMFPLLRHFGYSQNEKVRRLFAGILHSFSCQEATDEMIKLAIMDESKKVRLCALEQIKAEAFIDKVSPLFHLLTDTSYEIRRVSIPLIASVAKLNPLYIVPQIILFVNSFLVTNVTHSNPARSAKACSLMPLIAEHFVQFEPQFIPNLTWFCVWFLSHYNPIQEIPSETRTIYDQIKKSNSVQMITDVVDYKTNSSQLSLNISEDDLIHTIDLRQVIHRDLAITKQNRSPNNFSLFNNFFYEQNDVKEKVESSTRLSMVYRVENSKWIAKCDSFLFKTLQKLSRYLRPYMYQVIPVFVYTFTHQQKDIVYLAALNALRQIVIEENAEINIFSIFPYLFPALLNLIAKSTSKEIIINALKLTGTIGASSIVSTEKDSENSFEPLISIQNMSFFTDYVLRLLNQHFKEPSTSVCAAYSMIFLKDPDNAIPFLEDVIKAFVSVINREVEVDVLFNQLELIVLHTKMSFVPYLDKILPILSSRITNINCIRCCISLSYHLKSEFIDYAAVLYPSTLHLLSKNTDLMFYKTILKFISYVIIFQNQNPELFIEQAEFQLSSSNSLDDGKMSSILKSITKLVQLRKLTMFSSRISRICFSLLSRSKLSEVIQLVLSLCQYDDLSIDIVELFLNNTGLNIPLLANIREVLEASDFNISKNLLTLFTSHLDYLNIENPTESAFDGLKQPVFDNSRVWIDDLCTRVVKYSPSVAIRSCIQTIEQSQSFRSELFPFAFLSCWLATFRIEDRIQFSKTIRMILDNFETIDPVIIDLAQLADRVGFPLTVPDNVLANSSNTPSLSLYFLQRYLRDNPNSKETIEKLLELNSRMGFLDSARGLLTSYSSSLNELDKAKWFEQLGEFEKALDIFENQKFENNKTSLIHCYAQLEMWDRIKSLENHFFNDMTFEEKKKTSLWFSCAEYHYSDKKKAIEFLSTDYCNDDIDTILYRTIFEISNGNIKNASNYIKKGFELLAKNNTVFDGSDASQATRCMVYAQHFVELNEALWMKKENIMKIPKIWQNRIKNFSYESDAWIRMIEIRGLVLRPQDHLESYLQMVSVLRKERKWRLIDSYCERALKNINSPTVLLSRLKNLWARGEKSESLMIIKFINKLFDITSQEELNKLCQKYRSILPFQTVQNTSLNHHDDNIMYFHNELMKLDELTFDKLMEFKNDNKIDTKFIARMLRIQGNWEYKMYNSTTRKDTISPFESLTKITKVFDKSKELEPNDSRTWAGWAYANSRALSHADKEKRPQIAINAISGFLKATQLQPSESLEYLCQMFSIIFRYGVETVFDEQLHGEIVSLPPSIIMQIIPQIVVHIAHHDMNIRQLVQDIIYVFGSDHFEAVIYPLNVLSMIEDNEISSTAKSFIDALGITKDHLSTYSDARLFIKGMHKAAVSWIENWITTLETASKAQQRGKKETVIRVISKQFELLSSKAHPQFNFTAYQPQKLILDIKNDKYKDEETQCNNTNISYLDDMIYIYNQKHNKEIDNDFDLSEFDKMLSRPYGNLLMRCKSSFEKYKNGNDQICKTMWDNFRVLFNEFENHLKKIDTIQLNKISAELANKRGFNLSIPGTYEINQSTKNSEKVRLSYIEPALQVLSTQAHPRAVYMVDTKGNKSKFLLKGNEDLRLDQRIMQFFKLINSLLSANRNTNELGSSISQYAVVPFAPNAGLISWITGSDTLQVLVSEYRSHRHIRKNIEMDIITQFCGNIYNHLMSVQRHEVFHEVAAKTNAGEIREMLWLRSPSPSQWVIRNKNYTISTALMSMAGYTIGLGDRHPNNIMIQKHTGRVIHIDFGDSFEVAINRRTYKERVPFRLTRMILNALDGGRVDGLFRTCCENVLWVLRDNQSSIIAQLEVFVHEPIFYGREISTSETATSMILERVSKKLNGKDPVQFDAPDKMMLNVEQQVSTLIKIAADPREYDRHFLGWCPFW